MQFKKITALAVSAAVASSFTMTGCTNYEELLKSDRSGYLEIAFKNTAKAIAKKNKTAAFNDFISSLKKDCVSINVNNPDFDILMKMSGFHENKDKSPEYSAADIRFDHDGKSMKISTAENKERLDFSMNFGSGEYAYYINTADILEKLEASVWHPKSGSRYALGDENYADAVEQIKNSLEKFEENADDSKDEDISKYLSISSGTKETAVNGETVEADYITFSADDETIDDYAIDRMINSGMKDFYTDEEFAEYEKEIRESNTNNFSLSFYINKKTHCIMTIELCYDSMSYGIASDIDMLLTLGKDISKSDSYTLDISTKESSGDFNFDNSIKVVFHDITENETAVSSETFLTIDDGNDETENCNLYLTYTKADGRLVFSSSKENESPKDLVSLVLSTDANGAKITLDGIYDGSDENKNVLEDTAVSVAFTDEKLTPPKADKEFLTLTEGEIDSLVESISKDFDSFVGD